MIPAERSDAGPGSSVSSALIHESKNGPAVDDSSTERTANQPGRGTRGLSRMRRMSTDKNSAIRVLSRDAKILEMVTSCRCGCKCGGPVAHDVTHRLARAEHYLILRDCELRSNAPTQGSGVESFVIVVPQEPLHTRTPLPYYISKKWLLTGRAIFLVCLQSPKLLDVMPAQLIQNVGTLPQPSSRTEESPTDSESVTYLNRTRADRG